MTYAMYFERANREHIELAEWLKVIAVMPELQLASITNDDYNSWIGYIKYSDSPGQFHQREDRRYDAELFFGKEAKWKRVYFWSFAKSKKWGVITFQAEDNPASPVNMIANRIAELLGARIRGEDHTWYED